MTRYFREEIVKAVRYFFPDANSEMSGGQLVFRVMMLQHGLRTRPPLVGADLLVWVRQTLLTVHPTDQRPIVFDHILIIYSAIERVFCGIPCGGKQFIDIVNGRAFSPGLLDGWLGRTPDKDQYLFLDNWQYTNELDVAMKSLRELVHDRNFWIAMKVLTV